MKTYNDAIRDVLAMIDGDIKFAKEEHTKHQRKFELAIKGVNSSREWHQNNARLDQKYRTLVVLRARINSMTRRT